MVGMLSFLPPLVPQVLAALLALGVSAGSVWMIAGMLLRRWMPPAWAMRLLVAALALFGSVPLGYVVDARSLASRGGFLASCPLSSFHRLPLRRRSRASDCLRTPNRWASPVLSGRAGYPSIGLMKMCTDYRWRMPPPSLPLSIFSMRRACPPGRAYALPLRRAGDSWGARQVPISRRA